MRFECVVVCEWGSMLGYPRQAVSSTKGSPTFGSPPSRTSPAGSTSTVRYPYIGPNTFAASVILHSELCAELAAVSPSCCRRLRRELDTLSVPPRSLRRTTETQGGRRPQGGYELKRRSFGNLGHTIAACRSERQRPPQTSSVRRGQEDAPTRQNASCCDRGSRNQPSLRHFRDRAPGRRHQL